VATPKNTSTSKNSVLYTMTLFASPFFKKYLLPGFVFQSVVIAGGYGTGREIIEFFLNFGPFSGLLGMLLITTAIWSVIMAVTFEFSRLHQAYDYRTFFKHLLGKFWFMFEVLYLVGMLLVLAVIGSAAGILIEDNFGIPYMTGVLIMMIAIGFLTFEGSGVIEKFLAGWSIALYTVYVIIFVVALSLFGQTIQANFSHTETIEGWSMGGFKYALYNFTVIPAVLFCINHIETRKEAICAGLLGGLIGILPGILFFIAITSQYPEVLPEDIPMIYLLDKINITSLTIIFQIVLFGTLIETGTGFIHAFNERIKSAFHAKGKEFPRRLRPIIAVVLLLCGLGVSRFGLKDLIEQGYGNILSPGVFIVFVIPLMTVGLYKIFNRSKN